MRGSVLPVHVSGYNEPGPLANIGTAHWVAKTHVATENWTTSCIKTS